MTTDVLIDISDELRNHSILVCYPKAHHLLVNLLRNNALKVYASNEDITNDRMGNPIVCSVSFDYPQSKKGLGQLIRFGIQSNADNVVTKSEKLALGWDYYLNTN